MPSLTNDEIITLQQKVSEKLNVVRKEERELRNQYNSLEDIKFTARQVEDKPAEYKDAPDPSDSTKTIKVLVKPATMKEVVDVAPMSVDDPTKKLDEAIRTRRYTDIKATIK